MSNTIGGGANSLPRYPPPLTPQFLMMPIWEKTDNNYEDVTINLAYSSTLLDMKMKSEHPAITQLLLLLQKKMLLDNFFNIFVHPFDLKRVTAVQLYLFFFLEKIVLTSY